jgi:hypothetical protein
MDLDAGYYILAIVTTMIAYIALKLRLIERKVKASREEASS